MRAVLLILTLTALTSCTAPMRTASLTAGWFRVDQSRCADTPEAADAIASCIERHDRNHSG